METIDFRPELGGAFKALNAAWITKFFTLEPKDIAVGFLLLHRETEELAAKPTEGALVSRTCVGSTPPPTLRFAASHLPRFTMEDNEI